MNRIIIEGKSGDKMNSIGTSALIGIISHIIFIYITWTAIQGINFEPLVREGKVFEARVVIVFITVIIGSGMSRFVLEIIQWSGDLIFLF